MEGKGRTVNSVLSPVLPRGGGVVLRLRKEAFHPDGLTARRVTGRGMNEYGMKGGVTDSARLTEAQAAAAHRLAAAHGHHWTCLSVAEVVGKSEAEISALACEREEPGIGCMNDAPRFDERGAVVHVTGTGRLVWVVDQEGNVTLRAHRPASVAPEIAEQWGVSVVEVTLPATPNAEGAEQTHRLSAYGMPRHLDAVAHAVQALRGVNPNVEAALAWIAEQAETAAQHSVWELQERLAGVSVTSAREAVMLVEHVVSSVWHLATADSEVAEQTAQALEAAAQQLRGAKARVGGS